MYFFPGECNLGIFQIRRFYFSLEDATFHVCTEFNRNRGIILPGDHQSVCIIIVLLVIAHWLMRNTMVLKVAAKMPWWLLGIVWSVMIIINHAEPECQQFIYLLPVLDGNVYLSVTGCNERISRAYLFCPIPKHISQ